MEVGDLEAVAQEKTGAIHNENQRGGLSSEDWEFLNAFPEDHKKKILRKVDVSRSYLFLTSLTFVAAIDTHAGAPVPDCVPRQNKHWYGLKHVVVMKLTVVGNAKIEGLTVDLKLKGIQYNVVVAIFFIPFVLFGKSSPIQRCIANHRRGPLEHDPPSLQETVLVHGRNCLRLGHRHDHDGNCPKLRRTPDHQISPGNI